MLRLAIAQLRPRKGAYKENLGRLGDVFREAAAAAEPPELIVAPETALTGYFLEGGVRDLALSAEQLFHDLSCQHRDAKAPPLDVALGFYEVHQNRLFNSGLYATLGGPDAGIRHVHRKVFLPDLRRVRRGAVRRGGPRRAGVRYPLGPRRDPDLRGCLALVHAHAGGAGRRAAHHHSRARARRAASCRAEDAPGRPASLSRWSRIVQDMAGEHGVYVALAQLVGFEGGKAFPGGSLVAAPRGDLLAGGPVFEEALLTATLDFEEITRARTDLPLLADLEMRLPHLLGSLHDARRSGGGAGRRSGALQARRRQRTPTPAAIARGRCGHPALAPMPCARILGPAIRSRSMPSSPGAGWSSSSATRCSAAAGSSGS